MDYNSLVKVKNLLYKIITIYYQIKLWRQKPLMGRKCIVININYIHYKQE